MQKVNSQTCSFKKRIPNFEIMRVLAMWLIVIWHFFYHGVCNRQNGNDLLFYGNNICDIVNYIFSQAIFVFSSISVNLYVLISGYFLIESNAKWHKIPMIWLQTAFYSLCFYLIFCIYGGISFNAFDLIKSIAVIRFGSVEDRTYWFVAQYIGLLLLSPYLNMMASNLSKVNYRKLLVIVLLLDCSFGYLFYGEVYSGGQTLFHFVTIYLVAGYIRKFLLFKSVSVKKLICLLVLIVLLLVAIDLGLSVIHSLRHHENLVFVLSSRYLNYNGVPVIMAVLFFCAMINYKLRENYIVRILVSLAPYSFGVYLIHDNFYVRRVLWQSVTQYMTFNHSNVIVLGLIVATSIFLFCTGVDFLRKKIFHLLRTELLIQKLTFFLKTFFFVLKK